MRLVWLISASVLAFGGCSDDHEDNHTHDVPPECEPITEACHGVDDGTPGPAHDCHVLAHEGTADECLAQRDQCIVTCAAANDGGSDAAAYD